MTLTVCHAQLPPSTRESALKAFLTTFGGCTRRESTGYWQNAEGYVYEEPMDSWEVATDKPEMFAGMVLALGTQAGEEAVYVVIGTEARILSTEPEARAA